MTITRKVQRVGNSLRVVIPSQFAEYLGLDNGTLVDVGIVDNKGIVFTPVTATCQDESVIGAATHPEVCAGDLYGRQA